MAFVKGSSLQLIVPSNDSTVIDEVNQVIVLFRDNGLSLPCVNHTIFIKPGWETEDLLSQFIPGRWLGSFTINPLIASFNWNHETLVLYSDYIDLESTKPWPIEPHHKHIVLPSCHGSPPHWTLLYIDLEEGVVFWYNSRESPMSKALEDGIRSFLENHMRQRNVAIEFKIQVSGYIIPKKETDCSSNANNKVTEMTVVFIV